MSLMGKNSVGTIAMETRWGCEADVWPIGYLIYHPHAKNNMVAHLPRPGRNGLHLIFFPSLIPGNCTCTCLTQKIA
jgi:hypothetical protein